MPEKWSGGFICDEFELVTPEEVDREEMATCFTDLDCKIEWNYPMVGFKL